MIPLKEAALLPGMIKSAKSPITVELLSRRKSKIVEELARIDRALLLEEAMGLILRNEVKVSELASVFVELGMIKQNSHVGALKLALMLNDDRALKMSVEEALEKGVSIFEIREIVCEEGFAKKMDVVYSVVSPSALPSYEAVFRAKEKYFGREDVEGIKNAVALLLTKEKTTKMLRNEYRKKEYVKEYSRKFLEEVEKELEKIAKTEEGKVHEDDFALALYRAYFEDVCLFKNKEAAYHYLRIIERYGIRNPFLTAVIEHALQNGEKRAREKALMLIRDFNLNVNVENVLKSENLRERVIALQILFKRGWSEVFREMLFSEWYKERELSLKAFLEYKPGINEDEERWIRKLARTEIGNCSALAKEFLKKTAEMKMNTEKQKPMFKAQPYLNKAKETSKQAYVHAMGYIEHFLKKSRILAEKTIEGSAKIIEALDTHARSMYKNAVEASKNIFAYLGSFSFNLRLKWIEKRAEIAGYAKRMKKELQSAVFSAVSTLRNLAKGIKIETDYLRLSFDWRKVLNSILILATIAFSTTFSPSKKPSIVSRSDRIFASVLEKNKIKREEMISQLAQKVAKGELTLSDAIKMAGPTTIEKEKLNKELKKREPPKQKPRPRVEMDEKTKESYIEAMGTIAIKKGLDSFEYARGMLVEKYYSQNVGANKWINILIFGDNTAWTFPTADLGSQLSTRESLEVGDILLNHVGSAYVLSDDYEGGYLIAYHDAKNGLRMLKFTFEEIKSEFERVLSTEEANEFAKRKICEQLDLNPEEYTVEMRTIVFPTDYNCDRHWDDSLNCWVGDAHDYGALREGGARRHEGTDLYAPFGAPIYSPVDGVVVEAGWGGKRAGKRVWIQGVDGYYYMMAHLDSITVKVGQFVTAGTVVGTNGETGNAKGLAEVGAAHDHQEVHKGGRNNPIDPDQRIYDNWFVGLKEMASANYLNNSE